MWGEGLFLPIREKRLLKPLCVWHQFNYPVHGLCSQHFLNFISAAVLPHPPFSESPTPQRTNSIMTSHCSISTSWKKGASQAERRAHVRLGGPVQPYPSLFPITEFQAILETTLVLPGRWTHLHTRRMGHPSSQGTEAPAFGALSDCTLVVHLYPSW